MKRQQREALRRKKARAFTGNLLREVFAEIFVFSFLFAPVVLVTEMFPSTAFLKVLFFAWCFLLKFRDGIRHLIALDRNRALHTKEMVERRMAERGNF